MTEIIGVRFRGGPKEYYFDPRGIAVKPGQFVVVETSAGQEYARCVTGNREIEDSEVLQPLRPLLRVATEYDKYAWKLNREREKAVFDVCLKKIAQHKLDMKLVKAEIAFDGSKFIFFFTSDGRVDFRALVRDLASEFRVRIELRQIGVRDEAKLLGGIGICGRPFCCAEFLDDFIPVSIKMAKTQNLSLNPTKISGTCGRLMCCLKYEQDAYEDAVRRCPKQESFVMTPDGPGNITNVDILREQAVVRLDDQPGSPKRYRNCELNVLRSGRGSRDGIEIPRERPERYRSSEESERAKNTPRFDLHESFGEEPSSGENEGGKRRIHRGGRGRRRAGGDRPAAETSAKPEKPAKQDKPPRQIKAGANAKADKPESAPNGGKPAEDKSAAHRRHHRGGRSHRKGGGEGGAPNPEA